MGKFVAKVPARQASEQPVNSLWWRLSNVFSPHHQAKDKSCHFVVFWLCVTAMMFLKYKQWRIGLSSFSYLLKKQVHKKQSFHAIGANENVSSIF